MHSKIGTRESRSREEPVRVNEDNSHLKNLNQGLLEQIRKLKEEQLENLDIKDINKSGNEEGTAQDAGKSTKKKITSNVEVQTMEHPNILTNQNSTITKATSAREENHISKLKEENATSMIRESSVIRNPYRHPNHKRIYIN